jgi:ABC-2 type transport system ATP-binding protein
MSERQGSRPELAAIELRSVSQGFGNVRIIEGLILRINPGEVVGFLGPTGAGKTTTLDMVLGLSQPKSGTVSVYGMAPRAAVDAGRVAAVTQTGGLLGDITVGEHVRLIADLFGYPKSRADEIMETAGIAGLANRKTQACSGGEKQRLKFAMALVSNPDLIVLDEPTTGMDVNGRREFWADIHAQALRGRTVVFATHYLEEADEYADRIVVLVKGKVVADGTTAQIRAIAAGRRVTADFADHAAAERAAGLISRIAPKVTVQGPQLIVGATDSDSVVKAIFAANGHNVQVTSQGLEEAFIAITEGN